MPPLCAGGGGGGLTWIVILGEPSCLSQQCLSFTSAATCLRGFRVFSLHPTPDRGPLRGEDHTTRFEELKVIFLETPLRRWQAGAKNAADADMRGERVPIFSKVHVRTDPACRLHEVTDQDNVNAKVRHQRQGEPSQSRGDATTPACEPPGGDGPRPQGALCHQERIGPPLPPRPTRQVDRTRGDL